MVAAPLQRHRVEDAVAGSVPTRPAIYPSKLRASPALNSRFYGACEYKSYEEVPIRDAVSSPSDAKNYMFLSRITSRLHCERTLLTAGAHQIFRCNGVMHRPECRCWPSSGWRVMQTH